MPDFELTEDQSLELIRRERVVRIAFNAQDERYLIPFEGAFAGMTHAGRKTRMASENPRVAFQLDNSAETGVFGWHRRDRRRRLRAPQRPEFHDIHGMPSFGRSVSRRDVGVEQRVERSEEALS